MRKAIIAICTSSILLGLSGLAEAGKCKGTKCGPAVPVICETVRLDPDLWKQVRLHYWKTKGHSDVWWQPEYLACGGNCITLKRNNKASAYVCASHGAVICYKDSITGRKHVWTIDGKEEPVR